MMRTAAPILAALSFAGPLAAQTTPTPTPTPAPTPAPTLAPPPDYAQDSAWLCRPGRSDACAADQTATIINADGSREIGRAHV